MKLVTWWLGGAETPSEIIREVAGRLAFVLALIFGLLLLSGSWQSAFWVFAALVLLALIYRGPRIRLLNEEKRWLLRTAGYAISLVVGFGIESVFGFLIIPFIIIGTFAVEARMGWDKSND
ncbi:MAG: hypothetical protein HKN18_01015 [Silicimonas sp.]|nr:hypothetical protein [Silicimonas sp.]